MKLHHFLLSIIVTLILLIIGVLYDFYVDDYVPDYNEQYTIPQTSMIIGGLLCKYNYNEDSGYYRYEDSFFSYMGLKLKRKFLLKRIASVEIFQDHRIWSDSCVDTNGQIGGYQQDSLGTYLVDRQQQLYTTAFLKNYDISYEDFLKSGIFLEEDSLVLDSNVTPSIRCRIYYVRENIGVKISYDEVLK